MRIVQLTPGTGTFLCGSCLRDNELTLALRGLGHDALIAPLYLPFALEHGPAVVDAGPDGASDTVRMGGINVYLSQKLPLLHRLPRLLLDRLDSPGLLRWAASRSNMTGARGLGALTLSMLRGEQGRQRAELDRLVAWLASIERPDVVLLSNALLIGLARRIHEVLGCPVLCTLQGEAPFLDSLEEPYRTRCWQALAERAAELPAFLAVSGYTGELMRARLGLPRERVHVVWNGIDTVGFEPGEGRRGAPTGRAPTIGFLARMCHDKGLAALYDAFERVKERIPGARLAAAGVVLGEDRRLVAELEARARAAGWAGDVSFRPNVSREEKIRLLQSVDVVSVPATYGESFGLYVLEALACGVPVVQPRHGGFPEVIEATGGGLLVDPGHPGRLADALVELLEDPVQARSLGDRGRAVVLERFSAERMARDVERVCTMTAGAASTSPG